MKIPITIKNENALTIQTDVLILKHAQALYGADYSAASRLSKLQGNLMSSLPRPGKFLQIDSFGIFGAKEVLFVGVEDITKFRYQGIRVFARNALAYLAKNSPNIESVCFTLHGAGYGLDEIEAFESEIAGIIDAVSNNEFPENLKQITIVEIEKNLATRLQNALTNLLPQNAIVVNKGHLSEIKEAMTDRLKEAGYSSETKPLVFVAMPFDKKCTMSFIMG